MGWLKIVLIALTALVALGSVGGAVRGDGIDPITLLFLGVLVAVYLSLQVRKGYREGGDDG